MPSPGRGARLLAAAVRTRDDLEQVSVGVVDGMALLDLDYSEDSRAEVDFNVVATDARTYVEVQGTAEGKPFDRAAMDRLLGLADDGLTKLFDAQRNALATIKR